MKKNEGWICPKCGRGVSPTKDYCDCAPVSIGRILDTPYVPHPLPYPWYPWGEYQPRPYYVPKWVWGDVYYGVTAISSGTAKGNFTLTNNASLPQGWTAEAQP